MVYTEKESNPKGYIMANKNHTVIAQVAEYYRESRRDAELYADMRFFRLEECALEQMTYWKNELRKLVFFGGV